MRAVSAALSGLFGIVPLVLLVLAILLSLADAFRRKKALLKQLFEQAPLAITFTRADGEVVRVNAEFTRMFGYRSDEAAGRSLGDLIVPDDRRDELKAHIDSVADGQRVEAETVRRRKDGRQVPVAIVGVPVRVAKRQVGIYAMYADITEMKKAQEALHGYPGLLIQTQEAERGRLARELHDEIGQLLAGVGLMLGSSRELPPEQARSRVTEAQLHIDDLIARVRNVALALRPAMLDDLGLVPALLWLFERFTSQTGVRVAFRQSSLGDRRFGPEVELAAYHMIQEALTNVARHARVEQVTVLTWATSAWLGVEIEDRGVGFDPERQTARSLGLAGIRDRATLLGGRVSVDTSPGVGTRIAAALPLRGGAVN